MRRSEFLRSRPLRHLIVEEIERAQDARQEPISLDDCPDAGSEPSLAEVPWSYRGWKTQRRVFVSSLARDDLVHAARRGFDRERPPTNAWCPTPNAKPAVGQVDRNGFKGSLELRGSVLSFPPVPLAIEGRFYDAPDGTRIEVQIRTRIGDLFVPLFMGVVWWTVPLWPLTGLLWGLVFGPLLSWKVGAIPVPAFMLLRHARYLRTAALRDTAGCFIARAFDAREVGPGRANQTMSEGELVGGRGV
jgi:hypothetical protein